MIGLGNLGLVAAGLQDGGDDGLPPYQFQDMVASENSRVRSKAGPGDVIAVPLPNDRNAYYPDDVSGYREGSRLGVVPKIENISYKAQPAARAMNDSLRPEMRALLDTISGSEAPGYNYIYGGRTFSDYSDHPRQYVPIANGPNVGRTTSAAGRYQFLGRSWDEAKNALHLTDFSPKNQDAAAAWHASRTYAAKTGGRDLAADIAAANGDPAKLTQIGSKLSGWWTSLPGGIEPNKATSSFGNRFKQHLDYYASGAPAGGGAPQSAAAVEPRAPAAAPADTKAPGLGARAPLSPENLFQGASAAGSSSSAPGIGLADIGDVIASFAPATSAKIKPPKMVPARVPDIVKSGVGTTYTPLEMPA